MNTSASLNEQVSEESNYTFEDSLQDFNTNVEESVLDECRVSN